MIRRIQALNYRCLRYVDVHLNGSFHILVGPNASGKSTLLDVIGFLGDLISEGLDTAVEQRTNNFQDLVWDRQRNAPGFELAVEIEIPEALRLKLPDQKHEFQSFRSFRYEVAIQVGDDGLCIASEGGFLKNQAALDHERFSSYKENPFELMPARSFPATKPIPDSILTKADDFYSVPILQKSAKGTDTFKVETVSRYEYFKESELSIAFGPRRSTLKNLPEAPRAVSGCHICERDSRSRCSEVVS